MENFAIVAGGAPQYFPSRLAAVASHPGALTALGLRADGQGSDIDIDPQQALGEAMVRRLAVALQVIPGHPGELVDGLRCARLQGTRNGRLLGTPRPPKGALHRRIEANGAIALGDGLRATEDPQQAIEDLLDGAIADGLLRDLH